MSNVPDTEAPGANKSCNCYDHRYPSYNTVSPDPFARQGFLPAGAYSMTKNGSVFDYCTQREYNPADLYIRTAGPKMGVTMGSCLPRAVQSSVNDTAGSFTPFGVMGGAPIRGCYL